MTTSPEFLIEDILPANEVHLIGGASGSGKTTFVFQMFLAEWQRNIDFLGHKSHSVPYAYISLDRSRSSVTRTLERISLVNEIKNLICQEDLSEGVTKIREVVRESLKIYPASKLLIIEGFQLLAGDKGNSYTPVAAMLKQSARICSQQQLTILGICHSPKLKIDEGFQHPRELILGSAAWGAYSDTVMTLVKNESTGIITLHIAPRNAPDEKHDMRFGLHGILEPVVVGSSRTQLHQRISALPVGYMITTADLMKIGKQFGASETTIKRVIRECVANKVLRQEEVGVYTRTTVSPLVSVDQQPVII